MTIEGKTAVSVALCTCDRGGEIVAALRSILANTHTPTEVIIIDQSRDASTEIALTPFLADSHVRYIRTTTHGISRARNLAWEVAHSEIVVMTDDDCVVPEDWIQRIVDVFVRSPQLGMLYTTVYAAEHDPAKGSIPAIVFKENQLIRTIEDWRHLGRQAPGLGASMALRRSVAAKIGGFDPMLGTGEILRSGGELDFSLRALLYGHHVLCCADNSVVHYGFRPWSVARNLYYGYAYGPMAGYAKLARNGHTRFYRYAMQDFWNDVVVQGVGQMLKLQKPTVRGRMLGMMRGFVHGMRLPISAHADVFEDGAAHAEENQPDYATRIETFADNEPTSYGGRS